jgi:lanosterol synthase
VQHADSQVVQTAWACLALMTARCPDVKAIGRGIALIMSRQMANGEWLQEGIEGVFNKNCMISYPNYKFIFPIWALGRYSRLYGDDVVEV